MLVAMPVVRYHEDQNWVHRVKTKRKEQKRHLILS